MPGEFRDQRRGGLGARREWAVLRGIDVLDLAEWDSKVNNLSGLHLLECFNAIDRIGR